MWIQLLLPIAFASGGAQESAAQPRPCVVVVRGAAGESRYEQTFAEQVKHWSDAARDAGAKLVVIGDVPSSEPNDRGRLEQALGQIAADRSLSALWIVLVGHGTFDGREAKFNLRGPDVSADDLARWLEAVRLPVAVVNCASASAPFIPRLSGEGRVIVTATKNGQEINYCRLGEYLAAAIANPAADLDKDGSASLLEAVLWSSRKVDQFYRDEGRLATEHALIDDNGDKLGTPAEWFRGVRATRAARDGAPLDGMRAHQWRLAPPDEDLPPELRRERDRLEAQIERLRAEKSKLDEAEYYARLEALLAPLAETYQRAAGASSPEPAATP